jgi:hypothetical protein
MRRDPAGCISSDIDPDFGEHAHDQIAFLLGYRNQRVVLS